ncbi:MAG: type II secretion system F family protein [Burkholderiales bacterium]
MAQTETIPAQQLTNHSVIVGSHIRVRLRVREANGQARTLEYADITQSEAARRATARGYHVLSVDDVVDPAAGVAIAGGSTKFPLLLFSQELLALLDAGLNLSEALTTLHAKERQTITRSVLTQVLHSVRQGKNFSDVLVTMPQHFPEVFVAIVRASERTGDMPKALARYISYELQFDAVRKKIVSAAIYPILLLVVGGLVTLFLLGYVVPRFAMVYDSSGRDMPWLSAALLSFGRYIDAHWQLALGALVMLTVGLGWGTLRPQGRAWLLDGVVRLPWVAHKVDEFRMARFYRATSLLLSAGISLPRAMGMVSGLLGSHQRASLSQCRLAIEQGQSLSTALVSQGLASPVAESLIKVGERSGQLAEMLERTAHFADEDFARWIDWASKLLEPILMTIMGLVIGTVVVLMYIPIFDLAGNLR